jgi:hypothetical protein
MLKSKSIIAVASFLAFLTMSSVAYAKAPYIDYAFTQTNKEMKSCLLDAKKAMEYVGFVLTNPTDHMLIGINKQNKGVIACIDTNKDGKPDLTLFIVSGPNYKNVQKLRKRLKNFWKLP